MPDDALCVSTQRLGLFRPRAIRTSPDERRLIDELAEQVLADHPAWPWPLIEEETRRRAQAMLAVAHNGQA